jgi:mannose-6-phosphate isomerase-like protein (cupin superfamily)
MAKTQNSRRDFLKVAGAAVLTASPRAKGAQQAAKSASEVRRVVTGKDATGKSVAIIDGPAPNVQVRRELGNINTVLWVTDSMPADLSNSSDAGSRKVGVEPPADGSIFRVVEYAPQKNITADYDTRVKMMRSMGLAPEGPTRDHPRDAGMHHTKSLDYVLILSGEIDMLMDDSEVHLKAGDVVVQRGTNHAWVNRGNEPCKVAFILVDARS